MESWQHLLSRCDRVDWDMPLIDRSFDLQKVKSYLSLLRSPDDLFVSSLLEATRYVKYDEFGSMLLKSFSNFMQNIETKDFYLVLDSKSIGSEHWLAALLWPNLQSMNMTGIVDRTLPSDHQGIANVVIIDDAIYTGTNTFGKIDEFVYSSSQMTNVGYHFHIIVPFVSVEGEKFILDECRARGVQCTFYAVERLPGLSALINKYYARDSEEILRQRFGISLKLDLPIANMPAIYFDHKVAAPESTFSSIYLEGRLPDGSYFGSLFKVNPSRDKIEQLKMMYNDYLLSISSDE